MVNVMTVLNMMVSYKCQVLNFNYLTYFLSKTKKSCIGFSRPQNLFLISKALGVNLRDFVFFLHMILPKTLVTRYFFAYVLFSSQTKSFTKQIKNCFSYLAIYLAKYWPDWQGKMKKFWIAHCLESGRQSGQLLTGFWRGFRFILFSDGVLNPFEFSFMCGLGNS